MSIPCAPGQLIFSAPQLSPNHCQMGLRELLPAAGGDGQDQSDLVSLRQEAYMTSSEDKQHFSTLQSGTNYLKLI